MAKRSIKKGMRRMGVDNVKDFKRMQGEAMAGGVKLFEGDDKTRQKKCLAEIQRVCNAYDCDMLPEVTIGARGILAAVKIQAKPRQALGTQKTINLNP